MILLLAFAGLALLIPASPAAAKAKCKPAHVPTVELITSNGSAPFTLEAATQIRAPKGTGGGGFFGQWFIAGRIRGGPGDGQVGTWARVKVRPQADGLLLSIDAGALAAAPDMGTDLAAGSYIDLGSRAYDRVVACVIKASPA